MIRVISALVFVAVLSAGAFILWAPDSVRPPFLQSEFERFCRACEETLADRLRSPSSYVRLDCSGPYTETATRASYLDYDQGVEWGDLSSWRTNEIENGQVEITTAYLEYEAANAFGTSIRGIAECQVDHRDNQGLVDAIRITGPNVNGYDRIGWTIERLRQLGN